MRKQTVTLARHPHGGSGLHTRANYSAARQYNTSRPNIPVTFLTFLAAAQLSAPQSTATQPRAAATVQTQTALMHDIGCMCHHDRRYPRRIHCRACLCDLCCSRWTDADAQRSHRQRTLHRLGICMQPGLCWRSTRLVLPVTKTLASTSKCHQCSRSQTCTRQSH